MKQKKYKVLIPKYTEAGVDKRGKMEYYVSWEQVGSANSMREAKKLTKNPVLEDYVKRMFTLEH